MNAYELADKLQLDKARTLSYVAAVVDSAAMLRQQAEQIADLQTTVSFLEEECKALRGQVNETN